MKNKTIQIMLLVIALGLQPGPASASARLALVIGNSAYKENALSNPRNDAADIVEKLRQADFEVSHLQDLDRRGMARGIRQFARKLEKTGAVGLFYYAGHAVEVNGVSYLLPLGMEVTSSSELEFEAINVQRLLRQMEQARNGLNIVMIDACRNNPYRSFRGSNKSRGLKRMNAPVGSIISSSTASGKVAADGLERNSPYTMQLLAHFDTPGLNIEQFFKRVRIGVLADTDGAQIPWETSSLTEDFFFHPVFESHSVRETPSATENMHMPPQTQGTIPVVGGIDENSLPEEPGLTTAPEASESTEQYGKPKTYFEQLLDDAISDASVEDNNHVEEVLSQFVVTGEIDIESLLRECEAHYTANRLINGKGGNALACYQEVLEIRPSQLDALKGLTKIEDKYIRWVRREIERNKLFKAQGFLASLKQVNTDREEVGELEDAIVALRTTQQQSISVAPGKAQPTLLKGQSKSSSYEPEMVLIEGGCFKIGSPIAEVGRDDNEKQREVCVEDYQIGKYEVTQSQWRAVMGKNPSNFKGCEECPVEWVSWNDVQEYIEKLNRKTGRQYRLPTEAEWEHAARAGSAEPFSFNGKISDQKVNYNASYVYQDSAKGVFRRKTIPAGSLPANAWGLHEVHGNVWEWTASCHAKAYDGSELQSADENNACSRVVRGGSWTNIPRRVRSANRIRLDATSRSHYTGFRLSRTR